MNRLTRRGTLRAGGTCLLVILAGCSGDGTDGSGDDTPTPDDGGTSTPDRGTVTGTPDDGSGGPRVTDTEVWQLGGESGSPPWYGHDGDPTGFLALLGSPERVESFLDGREFGDERRGTVRAVAGDTDFSESVLLFVESVGPDTCHREVAVDDVAGADGRIVGTAAVRDPGDGQVCGEVITFPAALLRVTVEGSLPEGARFTVVDGWGEEGTVDATIPGQRGIDPDDLEGYVRPETDPVPVEALSFPDEAFQRVQQWFEEEELRWGETPADGEPAFALRVDALAVERGDPVTVTMTNVSGRERSTGNRHKYSLQVYTEEGWQDVRGHDGDPLPYTDEAVIHEPGEGFEWTVELTDSGVLEGHVHEDDLRVCPELPAGRYRFAFWEPTVGVAFDVE